MRSVIPIFEARGTFGHYICDVGLLLASMRFGYVAVGYVTGVMQPFSCITRYLPRCGLTSGLTPRADSRSLGIVFRVTWPSDDEITTLTQVWHRLAITWSASLCSRAFLVRYPPCVGHVISRLMPQVWSSPHDAILGVLRPGPLCLFVPGLRLGIHAVMWSALLQSPVLGFWTWNLCRPRPFRVAATYHVLLIGFLIYL